jgi:hypothetical protein
MPILQSKQTGMKQLYFLFTGKPQAVFSLTYPKCNTVKYQQSTLLKMYLFVKDLQYICFQ